MGLLSIELADGHNTFRKHYAMVETAHFPYIPIVAAQWCNQPER